MVNLEGDEYMSIVGTFMVPHPPLIVPSVGRGEEQGISATIAAYQEVARRVAQLAPETIVVTSPHTTLYLDYFHVSPGAAAGGNFAQFGAPQEKMTCAYDQEFTGTLETLADQTKLPAGTRGERDPQLDHATMVPLYFVNQCYKNYKLVRIGLSGLSLQKHYQLGQLIAATAAKLNRRVVFIASGDLSHKLKRSGPYGFDPAGPKYDKRIMAVMGSGAFEQLFTFDDTLCEEAAECGHRSFTIMAGALDGLAVKAEQLSYEGPFGVGYGVCAFTPLGVDENRHFGSHYDRIRAQMYQERLAKEDPYVKLARATIESFIKDGRRLKLPANLPPEMLSGKAGAFVSLKEHGQLRGCIGTIGPMQDNIAREIMHNAISAATEDPRFTPVQPGELSELVYSVDILGPLEPIEAPSQLDVKRYGVIVTKGSRQGLLLPNLEGVNSVEKQISIARQKAGIYPEETGVRLTRFEVVRHF
jgi:AmmeMemoRadiSam system protein A/AmmeMemoRadiSam system protein B